MKVIICALLIFVSISAKSQFLNFSLCMPPSATANADSVTLPITLYATDGYKSIVLTQVSGPSTALIGTPINSYVNTTLEQSLISIKKMVPGLYVFQATGLTAGGLTGSIKCNVTVPLQPAPRLAYTITIVINGVSITLPAAGLKIAYTDGTTQ